MTLDEALAVMNRRKHAGGSEWRRAIWRSKVSDDCQMVSDSPNDPFRPYYTAWDCVAIAEKYLRGEVENAGLLDDPELDCTDGAHPAWWRGQEHAVRSTCQQLNQIMDSSGEFHGCSAEPWHSTRERLCRLVRENAELREVVQSLQQEGSGRVRYD